MSLLLKNSIVIHAIQTKYSKFIIISQQKKVMNTRKMESSFIQEKMMNGTFQLNLVPGFTDVIHTKK